MSGALTRHGKGLRPCATAKIVHRFHVARLLGAATGATPGGSGQLATCDVLDQGQTGTCHAHSLVSGVYCALLARGETPPFVGSPRQLAGCTYADVRAASVVPGQTLPVLQDTGADLQDDATALAGWGLAPIQAPTSDGRYSDVENDPPDNTFPEVDPARLMRAVQVTGEYSIPVDADAPRLVALCIDAGIPVQIGIFVDTAFEELTPSQVAQPANTSDPDGGGHALLIRGYRTAVDGTYEFLVRNSWGASWCAAGDCWTSTAWLLTAWELFPVAVALAAGKAAA